MTTVNTLSFMLCCTPVHVHCNELCRFMHTRCQTKAFHYQHQKIIICLQQSDTKNNTPISLEIKLVMVSRSVVTGTVHTSSIPVQVCESVADGSCRGATYDRCMNDNHTVIVAWTTECVSGAAITTCHQVYTPIRNKYVSIVRTKAKYQGGIVAIACMSLNRSR